MLEYPPDARRESIARLYLPYEDHPGVHVRTVMQGKAWQTILFAWVISWPALAIGQHAGETSSPRQPAIIFQATFPTAERVDDAQGNLRILTNIHQPRPANATTGREHAVDFLNHWGPALRLVPGQWSYEKSDRHRGREVVHLSQVSGDLPVIGGSMRMTFSERGDLLHITCKAYRDVEPLLRGPISAKRARELARESFEVAIVSQREVALPVGNSGRMLLAHELLLERRGTEVARTRVRIDSRDGRVISRTSLAHAL